MRFICGSLVGLGKLKFNDWIIIMRWNIIFTFSALCHFSTKELSLKIISNFLFFMVIFRLPPQISPAFIKKYCSRDQKIKFTANIKIVVLSNFYVFWMTHLPSQIRCFNSNIKYLHFYSLSIGPKFVSFEISGKIWNFLD